MRNRSITILTTATLAAATMLTAGAATAAPAHRPASRVIGDCRHAQYEPTTVIIACGDAGIFFKDLKYTSWTATSAKATGQLWVNTDDPDAAAGHYDVRTVHATFDKPKTVHGRPRFSRIVVPYRQHGKLKHEYLYPPTTALG